MHADALRKDACGQRTDVDERSPVRPRSGETGSGKRSSVVCRPDEAATQRVAGDSVMRPGTAGLEAAQIVAAQEEAVDDLLTAARQQLM